MKNKKATAKTRINGIRGKLGMFSWYNYADHIFGSEIRDNKEVGIICVGARLFLVNIVF